MRNGGIFPLIIFLIIFINIIGPFTGLVFSFIPIFIVGYIFYSLLNNVYKKDNRTRKRKNIRRSSYTHKYEENAKTFVSNKDKSRIDDTLREYFKDHYELPVYDDIALVTKNGSYKSFEDLYIAKNKEVVMSLDEFGDMYASTYDQIIALLKLFKNEKKDEKAKEVKEKTPIYTSEAQKYILKINNLNNGIPQEEITTGLNQTTLLLKQIELSADDDDAVFIADAAHGGKTVIFLFAGKEQADDESQPGAGPERLGTAAFRKTKPDKADDEYSQGNGTAQDTAIHIESFFFRHMPSTSAG